MVGQLFGQLCIELGHRLRHQAVRQLVDEMDRAEIQNRKETQ
jgi:hypothetical protein